MTSACRRTRSSSRVLGGYHAPIMSAGRHLRDYPISDTEVIDVVKGLERLATMPDAQSWDCVASSRRGLVFADGEEAEVVAMMWSQHVAGVHDLPAEITGRDDVIEAVTTSGDPSYRFFTEDGLTWRWCRHRAGSCGSHSSSTDPPLWCWCSSNASTTSSTA
jgi:hypothetical protein